VVNFITEGITQQKSFPASWGQLNGTMTPLYTINFMLAKHV